MRGPAGTTDVDQDDADALIYDPDNNLDNRPPDSNFGSLSPTQINTDGDGVGATTYPAGTTAGTIEFEASDHSVTIGSWQEAFAAGTAKPLTFKITTPSGGSEFTLDLIQA